MAMTLSDTLGSSCRGHERLPRNCQAQRALARPSTGQAPCMDNVHTFDMMS